MRSKSEGDGTLGSGSTGPVEPAQNISSASDLAAANGQPTLAQSLPASRVYADQSIQSPRLAEFIRYSTQQAFRFAEKKEALPSAVLRDPAKLNGERINCEPDDKRDPAVLIDLDPGDELFDRGSPLPTSTAIALSLKVLRSEGVVIAWASANSAADADIIRDALTSSGLDPDAEDTLLLMRYPDDRKQTRRKEFADETCLIAIAGDNRRDFDELYRYLTNRDAAFALERLINDGWFLIGPEEANSTKSSDGPSNLKNPSNPNSQSDQSGSENPNGKQPK